MFTNVIDILVLGAILTPVVSYAGHAAKMRGIREVFAIAVLALSGISLYQFAQGAPGPVTVLRTDLGPLGSCLEIDALSILMASLFILLGFLSTVYSVKYMEHDTGLGGYYSGLVMMVAGMVGVAFAGDFFTLYIFWEIMSVASYALVAFRKERWEPVEAGFKYLIMSASGSALMLLAMSFLYGMTGTLNFAMLSKAMKGAFTGYDPWPLLTLAFIVTGFGVKAAVAPFHTWLPDAHPAAPSPVSSMLSGVMIKTGIYGLIRVLILVFAPFQAVWTISLMVLAVATMFVGNLMALVQTDLKRLLAYSSIAQIGYIIFGISLGTIYGLTGSIFHVMNHALMKGLLFMCAGAFLHATGTRDLNELTGIGRRMPVTGLVFAISAMAIMGVPTLNGFVSELTIVLAGVEQQMYVPTGLMLVNVAISVAYYLRILQITLLKQPGEKVNGAKEAPVLMLAPMVTMMILLFVIGLYPQPFLAFSQQAARAALDVQGYLTHFLHAP